MCQYAGNETLSHIEYHSEAEAYRTGIYHLTDCIKHRCTVQQVYYMSDAEGYRRHYDGTLSLHATQLWALEYNSRGIAFYQKHGFELTGEKMLEDEWVPLVKMALRSHSS